MGDGHDPRGPDLDSKGFRVLNLGAPKGPFLHAHVLFCGVEPYLSNLKLFSWTLHEPPQPKGIYGVCLDANLGENGVLLNPKP